MDNKIYWWGYLHSSGFIQIKRWFGDVRDFTEDCENNDFVLKVVPPFLAKTRDEAIRIIQEKLNEDQIK